MGRGGFHFATENSIAFGSAPPREADSQAISQSVSEEVSQAVIPFLSC